MPWLILFFAILYFVAAWQGENSVATLNNNFATDIPGFGKFALMVLVIWAIGLIPKVRPAATMLLALVLVSIALASGSGFFANLQNITGNIGAGPANTAPSQVAAGNAAGGSSATGGAPGAFTQAPVGSGFSSGLPSFSSLTAPAAAGDAIVDVTGLL